MVHNFCFLLFFNVACEDNDDDHDEDDWEDDEDWHVDCDENEIEINGECWQIEESCEDDRYDACS